MTKLQASMQDSRDPIRKSRINELFEELMPDCNDAEILVKNPVTEKVGGQLYYSAGSIGANYSEGYSRASGKDRARYYEYALGSVRESMSWYRTVVPVIDPETVGKRLDVLEEMRRILTAIIPRERDRTLGK
jgi:four helix bundle protein